MSDTALRQALVTAITVAVIGLAALALGAFFAPITSSSDAGHVVTAVLIRAVLAIVGLAVALLLTYMTGYRIETAAGQNTGPAPKPDPSASSGLITLLTTPGSRRDAIVGGGIVMFSYWLFTTLYVVALGKYTGEQPITAANLMSFLGPRLLLGLLAVLAGLGLGGLGARASLARRLTTGALMGARPPAATAPATPAASVQPAATPEDAPGDSSAAAQD